VATVRVAMRRRQGHERGGSGRIDQVSFRIVLSEHPQVALRVLDDVADRLARAHPHVVEQVTATVAQRVASMLLRLADGVGQKRASGETLLQVRFPGLTWPG
jgi:CRP-like cAMP-binding protein